ncbi:MAG: archaetidylinositol phosphate synthase [Candidatus Hadarchaeales archaeon]
MVLSELKPRLENLIQRPAQLLVEAGFTPNTLTVCGLLLSFVCFFVFGRGWELLGGLLLLVCGFFDVMDGAVARLTGSETTFGGFLDSVVDRYSDFLVLAGMMVGKLTTLSWGLLAVLGSFMVSYTRARAEAAGSGKLAVGFAERGERLLILSFFSLVGRANFGVALVAILANLTALHRVLVAWDRLT